MTWSILMEFNILIKYPEDHKEGYSYKVTNKIIF